MNLFVDLKAALMNVPAIVSLVGGSTTPRIWNSWARTYPTPCIVMDIDRESENNDLSGKGGLITADVTVTCRTDTHDTSDELQELVRSALAGYSGTFEAILDDTTHAEIEKNDGSTGHWYDHVMSFTMLWLEAV